MEINRNFWNDDYATENNLYDYCEDESYDKRMEIHIYQSPSKKTSASINGR